MTKVINAYYNTFPMPLLNKQFTYMPRFDNTQISKLDLSEIQIFFKPRIPDNIYKEQWCMENP